LAVPTHTHTHTHNQYNLQSVRTYNPEGLLSKIEYVFWILWAGFNVKFAVLMAMLLTVEVLLDVTLCLWVCTSRHIKVLQCFHLQDEAV
jgi:hypothetical protein